MTTKDDTYRFAFNELASVILYGGVLSSTCWTADECEKTCNAVSSIVERMKKLVEKMEE